jgi:hypothetical protein
MGKTLVGARLQLGSNSVCLRLGKIPRDTGYLEKLRDKCLLTALQNGAFDTEIGRSIWILTS